MKDKKLGATLKKAREHAGYSAEKLAHLIGVSPEEIALWETGEAQPDLRQWLLLNKLYGVTLEDTMPENQIIQMADAQVVEEFKREVWLNKMAKRIMA